MSADRALANQVAADLCWLPSAAPVEGEVRQDHHTWHSGKTNTEDGIGCMLIKL